MPAVATAALGTFGAGLALSFFLSVLCSIFEDTK